ncbi:MAG: response regulator [Bacteroidales bacterium]|nr:response regulator [Bacteroidales bacterium]HOY38986.1 response regulator [Bacteroidales bacterium]HQP03463.1 response regulator [Bacteroidales bacterium]
MENLATILLVEDNQMDVILTLDAFREAKLKNKISVARNGQEALDYLFGRNKFSDRSEFPLPNLILLDLKMPGIDGFEVLRQIKSSDILKRIPVIILTSSKEDGDRALSYDIGANSYLLKPVSFDGFTEVVKKIDDYWFTLNIGAPGL